MAKPNTKERQALADAKKNLLAVGLACGALPRWASEAEEAGAQKALLEAASALARAKAEAKKPAQMAIGERP